MYFSRLFIFFAILFLNIPILVNDVTCDFVVDFDTSMHKCFYKTLIENNQTIQFCWQFFKKLYDKNHPLKFSAQKKYKIPKLFHHVWLGGKLPEEYEPYWQSWLTYHPDWRFIFWTDNPENYDKGTVVESFGQLKAYLEKTQEQFLVVNTHKLVFENKVFFDEAVNYGERSDILKWEIVYRFGGVYVDTDFECLKSLDNLNCIYDFYTGIQPLDTNTMQLGAALFAAVPGHPIMYGCVNGIKYNQHIPAIVVKTGPLHFTRVFLQTADRYGLRDIALPASYFYPCSYEQRGMPKEIWNKPESLAIHHWAGSWLKPEAFVKNYS